MLAKTKHGRKVLAAQRRHKARKATKRVSQKDKQQDKRLRKIERMIKDEKKMCDILVPSQTLQQPNTLGVGVYAFHLTNLIRKGDNVYNRDGQKITLQNLSINLKIETDVNQEIDNVVLVYFPKGVQTNTAPYEADWTSVITDDALVKFQQMTKSLPEPETGTTQQYITDQSYYGNNQSTFTTLFNPNTDFSYKILFNRRMKLNNNSNFGNYGSSHDRYFNINLGKFVKGKSVEYIIEAPGSVSPPEVAKGSYVLYAWSDRNASTTGRGRISGRCRMKWVG